MLATIFYRTALRRIGEFKPLYNGVLAIGATCIVLATLRGCMDLPSHRPATPQAGGERFVPADTVIRWVVWPMLIWAFLIPGTLSGWLEHGSSSAYFAQLWLPLIYGGAMVAGCWGAAIRGRATRVNWANFGGWLIATLFSAVFIWVGLRLARAVPQADQAEGLAVAGPLWLILTNVLQVTLHLAIRHETLLGDLDPEWLARLSAVKLKVVVLWVLFAFCCLSLKRVAFHTHNTAWSFWAVPIITFAAGPSAAWLGKQAFTRVETALFSPAGSGKLQGWGLPLLALVFAVGLLTLLGYLTGEGLGFRCEWDNF